MKSEERNSIGFLAVIMFLLLGAVAFVSFCIPEDTLVLQGQSEVDTASNDARREPPTSKSEAMQRKVDASKNGQQRGENSFPASKGINVAILGVCFEDGSPVEGATVLFSHTDEEYTTSKDGMITVDASVKPVEITVRREECPNSIHHMALPPGEHSIAIYRGRSLAGRFLVDGHCPTKPIRFKFEFDGFSSERNAPSSTSIVPMYRGTSAPLDGSFEIHGLPNHLDGFLTVSPEYDLIAKKPRAIGIEVHSYDFLNVELVRFPSVTGRIIQQHSGLPVPNTKIITRAVKGRFHNLSSTKSSNDGTFEVAVRSQDVPIEFVVEVNAGGLKTTRRFTISKKEELAIGDIKVPDFRSAHFRVVGIGGTPIAGAIATSKLGEIVSSRSTTEGYLTISGLANSIDRVELAAHGHRGETVEIMSASSVQNSGQKVVLSRTPTLELGFHDEQGLPAADCIVSIFAKEPLFAHGKYPNRAHLVLGAASLRRGGGKNGSYRYEFRTNKTGRAIIEGLQPGLQIYISSMTKSKFPLSKTAAYQIPKESRLKIDVVVDSRALVPRAKDVRLTDKDGEPIAGAKLALSSQGPRSRMIRMSDHNGIAKFRDVQGLSFLLEATKKGYGKKQLEIVFGPNAEQLLEIELSKTGQ